MLKKMKLLAMAVGVLVVFAIPAAASATPVITHEGASVETVTATQDPENLVLTSFTVELSPLRCESIDLHIELSVDNTSEATGEGEGTATNCGDPAPPPNGALVEVTEIEIEHIAVFSNTTGEATFNFVYDVDGVLQNCSLGGTVGLTYAHGSNTITIAPPNALTGSPTLCPSGDIQGSFILDGEVDFA